MHTLNHNSLLKLRAAGDLVAATKARASREGITVSELMRRALDRELERVS